MPMIFNQIYKAARSMLLITVMLFAISPSYTPVAASQPSEWAQTAVEALNCRGLIPDGLADAYNTPITRAEFTALCACTHAYATGREVADAQTPFTDISGDRWSGYIGYAYSQGMAAGVSYNSFMPSSQPNRQECARTFCRLISGIEGRNILNDEYTPAVSLDDVPEWARSAVGAVSALGVMQGRDGGFAPKEKLTREEAMVSLYTILSIYFNMDNDAGIPVLMYHNVVVDGAEADDINISVSQFEDNLRTLRDAGYTTMLPRDAAAVLDSRRIPRRPVMITFDDGYESGYSLVLPLLEKYGMKATIFIVGSGVDEKGGAGMLSLPQCRELVQSGLVSIQPHSYNLHESGVLRADGEDEGAYRARFNADYEACRRLIEDDIGDKIYMYSYPHGLSDSLSEQLLGDAGVRFTVNSSSGRAHSISYNRQRQIRRIGVNAGLTGKKLISNIKRLGK